MPAFFRDCRTLMTALTLLVLLNAPALAANEAPLLRTPDIHGDLVVFVHGQDIWSAPAGGGLATRLTIDDGDETAPCFSPDGQLIAFSAQYDGNGDVYVMDRDGGNITRVTYHPGSDRVVGWHPVSGKIMFRATRTTMSRANKLYLINPDGTGLEEMIMYEAANGSFNADGSQLAYNRIAREARTWKRYQGGMAQDVWVYDFASGQDTRLTDFIGTDRLPMWIGDAVYFVSDREKTLNVFAVSPTGGEARKITNHNVFDARHASAGPEQIVYEHGGDIMVLDPATGVSRQLEITIGADVPDVRPVVISVADRISGVDVAARGKTALITARGEVFSVPVKEGRTVNLSRHDGARDHQAVFSRDGRTVAYLSDRNGEYAIWLQDADGSSPAEQLTQHESGYRHTLRWSPDGSKIAFTDETLRLYYADTKSGKVTEVAKADYENVDVGLHNKPISDYQWSPDSRWLTYSHMNADLLYRVYVHDVKKGTNHEVSTGGYHDFNPTFAADGQHLFFASNRTFNPTYGDFEWEMVYKDATGIFAVTLAADGQPVVPLPGTEIEAEKKIFGVDIDFEGLGDRIERLPLEPGNYRNLQAADGALFYLNSTDGDYNRFEFRSLPARDLSAFDFAKGESRTVIAGIDSYKLSADGQYIGYTKAHDAGVIAASVADAEHEKLDVSDLRLNLNPRHEWRQVFTDAWRFERDFYYDPNYHGLDWPAMRDKYAPLVERAVCRQDVQYIIGELIGELNTSHTYSYGGDNRRQAETVNVGMLGADWQTDGEYYRLGRILTAGDWTRDVRPPLVRPGLDVRNGDYLLAVNGEPVTTARNIYSYFVDLGGRQVSLTFNDKPTMKGAREVVVVPLTSENVLRYHDWVEHNRHVVEAASGGDIGYMHFPDTFNGTAREFGRQYYGQTRKQGLVIDGRNNNGGLDPDIFLQRLGKSLHTFWTRRHSAHQTTPAVVTRAHLALVTNHQAGSGGDMLPMEF
ncbi:MAG: PDZ domain-containing protein, partial [Candidatus Krumholzibacteria bacterium]|nr:PDZ domain-containing protein [Candidatus Krumholzibacteria bacterium]